MSCDVASRIISPLLRNPRAVGVEKVVDGSLSRSALYLARVCCILEIEHGYCSSSPVIATAVIAVGVAEKASVLTENLISDVEIDQGCPH